jgi:hypothetical protein
MRQIFFFQKEALSPVADSVSYAVIEVNVASGLTTMSPRASWGHPQLAAARLFFQLWTLLLSGSRILEEGIYS